MKKLVKYVIITVIFAVLFVGEVLAYMKADDRAMDRFRADMERIVGSEVYAEYYNKNSGYGEEVIVYCYGGTNDLYAAVSTDSNTRYNSKLKDATVQTSVTGDRALNDIKRNHRIALTFASITFIAFIITLVKSFNRD